VVGGVGMTKQRNLELKISVYRLMALKKWKEMDREDETRTTKSMLKGGWKKLLRKGRAMKVKLICGKTSRSME
jgi:hypothetical protein